MADRSVVYLVNGPDECYLGLDLRSFGVCFFHHRRAPAIVCVRKIHGRRESDLPVSASRFHEHLPRAELQATSSKTATVMVTAQPWSSSSEENDSVGRNRLVHHPFDEGHGYDHDHDHAPSVEVRWLLRETGHVVDHFYCDGQHPPVLDHHPATSILHSIPQGIYSRLYQRLHSVGDMCRSCPSCL